MSDACGCGSDEPRSAEEQEREPERLWQITELQFAALSGVLLLAALIANLVGAADPVVLTLEAAALLAGAYTFVLPASRQTPRLLQTKQKTIGLRVPNHPVPLALVQELGGPIISTSANRSNEEVLTDPQDLQDTLGHEVDLILECGPLPVLPSSVVSLVGDQVEVLRQGLGVTTLFDAE